MNELHLPSARPEMANLPDIFIALNILSSEYQPYDYGKLFARLDLNQIFLFLDGHYLRIRPTLGQGAGKHHAIPITGFFCGMF